MLAAADVEWQLLISVTMHGTTGIEVEVEMEVTVVKAELCGPDTSERFDLLGGKGLPRRIHSRDG